MVTAALHRGLGDERRRRILAELEAVGAALDASEIGRRVGLHPNTVRWHLGLLADAGLVRSRPAWRETPGRPRIVYELDGRPDESPLVAAGRTYGRQLVRRGEALPSEEDAVDAVVRLLAEQGFEPRAEGREIELRRCPFHDLAGAQPNVVCAFHRGLVSGALAELGSRLTVAELEILPRPEVCVLRLAPGRR